MTKEQELRDRHLYTLFPSADYHEDYGPVLWWHVPICEPPYVGSGEGMDEKHADGTPTDCVKLQRANWLTHWSFLPDTRLMDIPDLEWPNCKTCAKQSNFAINGVVQDLCYEHHPRGHNETPLPRSGRVFNRGLR